MSYLSTYTNSGSNLFTFNLSSGAIATAGDFTAPNLVYNSGDQTIAGVKTFSNNIVGNGTDNTLPNQALSSNGSIITRGLGDIRYGNFKFVSLSADEGTNSTTPVNTSLSLTLETGKWNIEGWLYVKTASITAGAQCDLRTQNSADNTAGTTIESRGVNSNPLQRFLTATGAAQTVTTILCDGGAASNNQNAYGYFNVIVTVASTATYPVRIYQRTTTDVNNPSYLAIRSWMKATKIS